MAKNISIKMSTMMENTVRDGRWRCEDTEREKTDTAAGVEDRQRSEPFGRRRRSVPPSPPPPPGPNQEVMDWEVS